VTAVVGERRRDAGEAFDVDPRTAYPARIFDYLLGGADNFAVDREAADRLFGTLPGGIDTARRVAHTAYDFVARAVRYLSVDAGIRQFLSLGNVVRVKEHIHEVAQEAAPGARVVYVLTDAVVLAHAHELRVSSPEGQVAYIDHDLRDLPEMMQQAAETLDLSRPVALVTTGILHYVSGKADPHRFVTQLVESVVPGSYLVVSHAASDIGDGWMVEVAQRQEELRRTMRWPLVPRSRDEVTRFLDGLELVDPGVVTVDQWHPPSVPRHPPTMDPLPWYAAIARKP
jgi:S-adenosyl methyltransferase